jgi:hypothetical protein
MSQPQHLRRNKTSFSPVIFIVKSAKIAFIWVI